MERCLPGFSQNQNESFNSLIWKRAPKCTWQGPKRIKIAAYLAALQFNTGSYETRTAILSGMEITPSLWLEISADKKDKKRIYGANRDAEEAAKKKRRSLAMEKQDTEESWINNEGTTYGSGYF